MKFATGGESISREIIIDDGKTRHDLVKKGSEIRREQNRNKGEEKLTKEEVRIAILLLRNRNLGLQME